jgi:phage baseplate assembly protein W|tara:strand:- start:706 stop:1155 length:450 start_codon:yes stop_codon:yes gene_type:complete
MARAFSVEDGKLDNQVTLNATNNREYIDIDMSFSAKPTGDIYKKNAVAAVKQSLKNILMTARTEKPFQAYFGCNLNSYLFELADAGTVGEIKIAIRENVRVYEPRVDHKKLVIRCVLSPDDNTLTITLVFNVLNSGEQSEFTTRLNRLR